MIYPTSILILLLACRVIDCPINCRHVRPIDQTMIWGPVNNTFLNILSYLVVNCCKRVWIMHILKLRLMGMTWPMQKVLVVISHTILFIVVMRSGLCLLRGMNRSSSGGPVYTLGRPSTTHDQLLRLRTRFIHHGFPDCHLSVLKDLAHIGLVMVGSFLFFKLGARSA